MITKYEKIKNNSPKCSPILCDTCLKRLITDEYIYHGKEKVYLDGVHIKELLHRWICEDCNKKRIEVSV